MKILLTGADGQLAWDLKSALARHELVCVNRSQLDICHPEQIEEALSSSKPELVINTAAYNQVDQAESMPDDAFAVNAHAIRHLAIACGHHDVALLHYSTDYVFGLDSKRRDPWSETDAPGPVSVYGASKLAGEYFVRTYCPKHFVVRTCGLYGVRGSRGKGGNFVETMLRLGTSGKPVRVVHDQQCTPSFTADIAAASAQLIERGNYGLYHLTNAGACTWYELACEVFRQTGLSPECIPITSAEYGAAARRPANSVLSNERLASAGVSPLRDWRDALTAYLEARSKTNDLAKPSNR